jgi:hypothetical protein
MGNRFFGPAIDVGYPTETAIQEVLPSGGKVSNLRVYLTGKAGDSSSDIYTFVVRRDPAGVAPPVNTSITCAIKSSSQSCEDKVDSQTFAAGDAISVLATESNTPESGAMFFRLDYQP